MAEAYLASLLPGKAHLARTPDGGLLCKDVCIARSGGMTYAARELGIPGGDERVTVWRKPKEVTSRRFLASCEGAVVTDQHPTRFVDTRNYAYLTRGHMQNVRVGPTDEDGNVTAVADLFIKEGGLADKVASGMVRDVSIGYNLDVVKDEIGRWSQVNLRCNHVAVVPKGRGGSTRIVDSRGDVMADNKWKCICGNINHPDADNCAACGAAQDEQDLVPIEQGGVGKATRDSALRWLRKIKPQVKRRGTDAQKMAWNSLYLAIRDAELPELALSNTPNGAPVMAADGTSEDTQRAVADDFVKTCASYLGQDINSVASERKTRALHRAVADSKTTTESLVNVCAAYLGADDIHEVERKLRNKD